MQEAIRRGKITQGHARALLPLGDEREQMAFCRADPERGAERPPDGGDGAGDDRSGRPRAAGRDRPRRQAARPRRGQSEHVAALEQEFRAALGVRVKIDPQRPRPRQAGDPLSEPRGVRADAAAHLRFAPAERAGAGGVSGKGIWGFGDLGIGDLGIWGFGDLGIWGFGDLGIWGFGDLGIWGFGDLGIWGFGDLGSEKPRDCVAGAAWSRTLTHACGFA